MTDLGIDDPKLIAEAKDGRRQVEWEENKYFDFLNSGQPFRIARETCERQGIISADRFDDCIRAEEKKVLAQGQFAIKNDAVNAFFLSTNFDQMAMESCRRQGIAAVEQLDACVRVETEKIKNDPRSSSLLVGVNMDDYGIDKAKFDKLIEEKKNQFVAFDRERVAVRAFQGVTEADFAGELASLMTAKYNEKCENFVKDEYSYTDACIVPRRELVELVFADKQNQVYIDSCRELGGGEVCSKPENAKKYLLTQANPELTRDQVNSTATNLRPELSGAVAFISAEEVSQDKNMNEIKNVVGQVGGGLGVYFGNVGTLYVNAAIGLGRLANGGGLDMGEFEYARLGGPLAPVNQQRVLDEKKMEVEGYLLTTVGGVAYSPEEEAKRRMESELTKLGRGAYYSGSPLDEARIRVENGESWQDIERDYQAAIEASGMLGKAVIGWNSMIGGRFSRGNAAFLDSTNGQGLAAFLPGGSNYTVGVDAGQMIRGAVAQGGDAAAAVTALAAIPIAGVAGLGAAAIPTAVQTGIFGVAGSTQMLGMAGDACEQANRGLAPTSQCVTSTALFVTSALGTTLGVARGAGTAVAPRIVPATGEVAQAAVAGGRLAVPAVTRFVGTAANTAVGQGLMAGAEIVSHGLGFVTFSEMAREVCEQSGDIHCVATALMAYSAGGQLISGLGASAGFANTVANLDRASRLAFVGSACSGLVGSEALLDSMSMCGMALHGAVDMIRSAATVKPPERIENAGGGKPETAQESRTTTTAQTTPAREPNFFRRLLGQGVAPVEGGGRLIEEPTNLNRVSREIAAEAKKNRGVREVEILDADGKPVNKATAEKAAAALNLGEDISSVFAGNQATSVRVTYGDGTTRTFVSDRAGMTGNMTEVARSPGVAARLSAYLTNLFSPRAANTLAVQEQARRENVQRDLSPRN